MTRSLVASTVVLSAITLLVAGCSVDPPPAPGAEPAEPGAVADPDPDGPPTECLVGDWALVVPAYALEAEQYLLGLGAPIEGFGMTGSQVLTLTEDGLLQVVTNLTSSGSIVTETVVFAFSETTAETATAEWGWSASDLVGQGTIEVAEYQVVDGSIETPGEAAEAGVEPPLPVIGEGSLLAVDCDAETMLLTGGGPLSALFERA